MRRNWIKMFSRMPNRNCLWIVSYLMILVITKECSSEMVVNRNFFSSFSCAEAPNCTCTSRSDDFEISCSNMNGRILVHIYPHYDVNVECISMDDLNYLSLPRITYITEKILQIENCPLPRNKSIQAIGDRIGMQSLQRLYFNGVKNGSDVALSRQHFKGLETLELLNLRNNGFSVIPADTFADLRSLVHLDLKRNEISRLEDIFNGLENLEYIDLAKNKIEQIPEGIFSTQKNLQFLKLWDNRLQNLSKNSFTGAVSLRFLNISSNNMEYLQNDLFYQMKNLGSIDLTKNSFKSLPAGLFKNNYGLTKFRMLENEIALETLPDAFLANKPNLIHVDIGKCGLKTIPENLLSNSTNLNHISLAYNDLESLPPNLLADQYKLRELYLSNNKIVHLDDSLLAHTLQLEKLDLSHNRLTEISRDIFGRLRNLKYLILNNNRLTNFNSDALLNAKALTQIDLQNNKLSFDEKIFDFDFRKPSPFRGLSELKKLNLRNNSISYNMFLEMLFITTNLEEFDLSYNNITNLDLEDLQFLQKEINVNITNNFIKTVNFRSVRLFEANQNESDVIVYLEKNPIECECGLLDFVKYIKRQKQKDYKRALQTITENIKCSSPKTLEGRRVEDVDTMELLCPLDPPNRFEKQCPEHCSCWLRPVDKTLIVNCSNLNLVGVPKLPIIDHAEWQTELRIENNEIGYLPTLDIYGYKYVSKIYATNNNLFHLTTENIPHHLSVIDISNNKFSALYDSVLNKLENMTTLTNISLGGTNPWLCNCDLLENLDFIRRNFKKITDLDAIRCTTGEQISTLAPSDICPENIAIIAVSVFFTILSLIIGIFSALYYKYQMQIKVWLYAHNWCLWLVTEDELDKDKSYDAFISYSHKDEDFVAEHLVPQLEKGPITYKLCLHARDWMAGEFIPNQIVKSVEDSRRTIVVLSPNFVTSVWGRMEFRAAHTAALKEGRTRVIVVIYEDVGDIEKLDAELKAYLTMNTYVKWNDPWFWEKLRYALPHTLKKSRQHQALILKKDERIELTMPGEYIRTIDNTAY